MAGLLSSLLAPSSLVVLLFGAGVLAMLWRAQRIAVRCFLASGFLLTAFSSGVTAVLLLSPLEYAYPALRDPAAYPAAKTIVVLTAYAADDADMTRISRMNASSAFRVLEAASLWRRRPDCRILVTGNAEAARIMAEALADMGVRAERIEVDGESAHTADSAVRSRSFAGSAPLFLVTSGGHMPRAVAAFRKQGLDPISVPTDHQLPRRLASASWGPSAFHLQASDLAVHEYIALVWYRLRGQL